MACSLHEGRLVSHLVLLYTQQTCSTRVRTWTRVRTRVHFLPDSDLDSDLKAVDLDFLVSAGLGLGLGFEGSGLGLGLGYWWTCYKSDTQVCLRQ